MPGAPLEPGKAFKDGGGPYGFPGAIGVYRVSIYSATGHRDMAVFISPPYGLYAILRAVLGPLPRVTVACCSLTMPRNNACRKPKREHQRRRPLSSL